LRTLREAGHIEVAQREGRLAEAAELGAEARFVQPVAGSRRERGGALHRHLVSVSAADEGEWLAGGTKRRDIQSNALGRSAGGNGGEALTGAGEQRSFGGAHHGPAGRNILRRLDRLPDLPVLPADRPHAPDPEAAVAFDGAVGMLEAEPIAALDRLRDYNDQLVLFAPNHFAEYRAAVVGLGAGHVVPPRAAAVHPAGEAAREDLHQGLDFGRCGRTPVARGKSVEKDAVAVRHGRHVFGFLLAAFDLERVDAGVGDLGEMLPGAEVPGGDQVAAVQLRAARGIRQDVVLAARLGAGSPVGAALGNHAGHVTLSRVRDAERAVDEALQHQLRDCTPDGADVVQGILTREHHAVASQVAQDAGAALSVAALRRHQPTINPSERHPDVRCEASSSAAPCWR